MLGSLIAHKRRHRYAAAAKRADGERSQHFSAMRKNFSSKVGKGPFPSSREFSPPSLPSTPSFIIVVFPATFKRKVK
jgi:hypothetical protein